MNLTFAYSRRNLTDFFQKKRDVKLTLMRYFPFKIPLPFLKPARAIVRHSNGK